jgi:DNA-binding response OmpR family regulator
MKHPNGNATDSAFTEPLRPAQLSPAQKRELVARIARTPHLNRSVRLTELLTYLVERSIGDVSEGLREQEIGANLFGRDPNYDTSQDNIVRVQVSQLRKKLESYFSQVGKVLQLRQPDQPVPIL